MASKEALEGEEIGGPLLKEKRGGGGKEPLEMEGGEVGGVLEVEEWEEVDSEERRGGGGGLSLSTDISNSESEIAVTNAFVAFSPSNSTLCCSSQLLSWFDLI